LQSGDGWVFDRSIQQGANGYSDQRLALVVERVDSDAMVVGIKPDGAPGGYQDHIVGLDWSQRRIIDGQETVTGRPFSFPLTVSSAWTADYDDPTPHGQQLYAHVHRTYRVVGWEDVVVPAGTFRAVRIEMRGTIEARLAAATAPLSGAATAPSAIAGASTAEQTQSRTVHVLNNATLFYVPSVKYFAKNVEEQYNSENVLTRRETNVLVSFKVTP
jgi:hypothetical protein